MFGESNKNFLVSTKFVVYRFLSHTVMQKHIHIYIVYIILDIPKEIYYSYYFLYNLEQYLLDLILIERNIAFLDIDN